jgi:K+-sensing histidine kinase KdpD
MVDNGDCLPPMASTAAESPPLRQIDTTGIVIGVTVGIPGAIGTAALLALARGVFDQTNAALILMIVVVAVAAIGGRTAGMITALAAVASFDFFHTRPYLSLTIDSRDDVETTILLLIAGLIVGTLASSGRRARHEATDARTEIGRIHRVAEAAAVLGDVAAVIGAAQEELRALLTLRQCRFEAMPFADTVRRPRLGRNGAIEMQTTMRFARTGHRTGFELPAAGVDLPVLARGLEIGRFVLMPTPGVATTLEERIVAVAIADQVAAIWTPEQREQPR